MIFPFRKSILQHPFLPCCITLYYRGKQSTPSQPVRVDSGCFLFLPIQRRHSERKRGYVLDILLMPWRGAVCTLIVHSSYGSHFLDHLAAHGAGLTGGQVTVVALLQVDAHLP